MHLAQQSSHTTARLGHDFSRNPMLVYWEMTQACALACKHCRADTIRAVPGCFERTIAALHHIGRLGIPVQINTLVAEETADDLLAIYQLLKIFLVMRWSLFFLISVAAAKLCGKSRPNAEKN